MEKMKAKLISLLLILILPNAVLFAENASSGASVREYFPSLAGPVSSAVLPVNSFIGLTVPSDATSNHVILCNALKSEYNLQWTETYLEKSVKSSLVRLFNSLFSSVLPAQDVMFSAARENADGSVTIGVVTNDHVIEFVMSGEQIVSVREIRDGKEIKTEK